MAAQQSKVLSDDSDTPATAKVCALPKWRQLDHTLTYVLQAKQSPASPLQRLPAELRNNIYELTFASDTDSYTKLTEAAPPSKSLIFTCRKIYQEARSMYRNECRRYWRETRFFLAYNPSLRNLPQGQCAQVIRQLITAAVPINARAQVRHLNVHSVDRSCYKLVDQSGVWAEEKDGKTFLWVFPKKFGLATKFNTLHEARANCSRRGGTPFANQLRYLLIEDLLLL